MIAVFCVIIAAASGLFWLVSQYAGGAVPLICYAAVMIAVCTLYFVLERRKRAKLISRVTGLFEGGYESVTSEDELSALERKVVLSLRSSAAHEARVNESYRNIAGLVSDISHQCKTPLTSILMYSEFASETELPSETELTPESGRTSDFNRAAIYAQAEKLSFLLDALTKLSKCEGGLIGENLHPAENPVGTLVIRAVNGIIAAADSRHIEIRSDIPDGLNARFDLRWTAEALFNLLDNAVKYSDGGGSIAITAREYEMFVRIDVADCGIGISEAEQTNIWKRFYRGKNVGDTTSGVGIGLYLSRLILNGEGGSVSVKSRSGQGSTFSVYLPRL